MLKDIKEGDVVVRGLTGGGFTTESLVTIEHVDKSGDVFIEGADGDYAKDSVYRFDRKSGRSVNNYTSGFYSTILRKATDDDIKELSDD